MAELIIDRNYYNKLDIEGFSKMMSSPSYCYKFYWLEAIVQLISANRTEATYDEIINKMIVNAWFPVQEYHIHLSGIYGEGEVKDNLEKAVSRLFKLSDLPSNADEIQIINKLNEFLDDKELHFYKTELTKNVPYKALSGFANIGTEKIDLNSSAGRMECLNQGSRFYCCIGSAKNKPVTAWPLPQAHIQELLHHIDD